MKSFQNQFLEFSEFLNYYFFFLSFSILNRYNKLREILSIEFTRRNEGIKKKYLKEN